MTQFLEVNLANTSNEDFSRISSKPDTCFCCLEQNVSFVNLSTCKHTSFFTKYFRMESPAPDALVCTSCHSSLNKIEQFKQQVNENLVLLSDQKNPLKKNKKLNNLQQSKLVITWAMNNRPLQMTEVTVGLPLEDTAMEMNDDQCNSQTSLRFSEIKKEFGRVFMETMSEQTPESPLEGQPSQPAPEGDATTSTHNAPPQSRRRRGRRGGRQGQFQWSRGTQHRPRGRGGMTWGLQGGPPFNYNGGPRGPHPSQYMSKAAKRRYIRQLEANQRMPGTQTQETTGPTHTQTTVVRDPERQIINIITYYTK